MLYKLCCLLIISTSGWSQVGIGTLTPEAMLDVNGTLKLRTVPTETNNALAKDSIMVTNAGFVRKAAIVDIVNEEFKTTIKGNFTNAGTINLSLLTGTSIIPFDNELFDDDNSYDNVNYAFTAKVAGIYQVNAQIKISPTVAAATNLGICVVKNGASVIHRSSYANVVIAGVNATPPERQIHTLINLAKDDVIHFEIEGDIALGSVNLLGNSDSSYFTVHRIR